MLYEKVCAYCLEHGITIAEFERLCGIGNGTVSQWDIRSPKKTTNPTLNTIAKICNATNTKASEWIKDGELDAEVIS